jgi:hypothetical protein
MGNNFGISIYCNRLFEQQTPFSVNVASLKYKVCL